MKLVYLPVRVGGSWWIRPTVSTDGLGAVHQDSARINEEVSAKEVPDLG